MSSMRWRQIAKRYRYGCCIPMPRLDPTLFGQVMKASGRMLGVRLDAKGRRIA